MIRHEQSNKHLFTFLVEFRAFNWEEFEEESDDDEGEGDELAAVVLKWIDAQRAASLKTLRTVSKDDFPILSQLAVDYGGLTFVRDRYVSKSMKLCHRLSHLQHITPARTTKGCIYSP